MKRKVGRLDSVSSVFAALRARQEWPQPESSEKRRKTKVVGLSLSQNTISRDFTGQLECFNGAELSPDESIVLVNTSENEIWKLKEEDLSRVGAFREAELIYDFDWFPAMDQNRPETCCFLSCSRRQPIHLWDANREKVCASYCPMTHLDELSSTVSVKFNRDGTKIAAGTDRSLFLFDTQRPGAQIDWANTPKRDRNGQRGIYSSIDYHSARSAFAVSSFNGSWGIYPEKHVNERASLVLKSHDSGISHIKFAPCGNFVFCGGRKDGEISIWDLRNLGEAVRRFNRSVRTNQKLQFCIFDDKVISGDSNGHLNVFNWKVSGQTNVVQTEQALGSVVNGVSVAKGSGYIFACTGERDYDDEEVESSSKVFRIPHEFLRDIKMVAQARPETKEIAATAKTT